MNTNLVLLGFLAFNFIASTAGDSLSKVWATHPGPKWALIVIGINIFTTVSWMLVVRRSGLTAGGSVMLLLTMLSTVLIGLFIFREQITRGQELGIILGLVASLFLLGIARI